MPDYPIKIKEWNANDGYTFEIEKDGKKETHKFIGFVPGNLTQFYTELMGSEDIVAPAPVAALDAFGSQSSGTGYNVSQAHVSTATVPGAGSNIIDNYVNSTITKSVIKVSIENILQNLKLNEDNKFNVVTKNDSTFTITIKKIDDNNFNYTGLDGKTLRKNKYDLTQYLTIFKQITPYK